MLSFPRRVLAPVTLTAVGMLALAGCTSQAAPSVATSPSTAAGSSSGGPSSTPADNAVTLRISIAGGRVSPNGDKVNVVRGQTVILRVTSDIDDEIHAHTGGDGYELEVKAGTPTTGQFVAGGSGSFEVESHHLGKIIAVLVVR